QMCRSKRKKPRFALMRWCYCWPLLSKRRNDMTLAREYAHGAIYKPDGTVRFRLWAPGVDSVLLHVGADAIPMDRLEEGWFEARKACPPGTLYTYEPAGLGRRVADPASRLQARD